MLYAIICLDKPGALQTRLDNREAHLAHIEGAAGAIVQAGPFLDA
ncbi:MAG: YciI family protein, partial [Pseudomonadota bacterium]